MAGIFGGHLFTVPGLGPGLGQTTATEDAEFSSLISSLATPTTGAGTPTTGTKTGGAAYIPPTTSKPAGGAASPAYLPGVPTASPTANNTALYVVGGVAVVGILGLIMMSGRRGSVAANRGRRGRRSRSRRSR